MTNRTLAIRIPAIAPYKNINHIEPPSLSSLSFVPPWPWSTLSLQNGWCSSIELAVFIALQVKSLISWSASEQVGSSVYSLAFVDYFAASVAATAPPVWKKVSSSLYIV